MRQGLLILNLCLKFFELGADLVVEADYLLVSSFELLLQVLVFLLQLVDLLNQKCKHSLIRLDIQLLWKYLSLLFGHRAPAFLPDSPFGLLQLLPQLADLPNGYVVHLLGSSCLLPPLLFDSGF